MMKINKNFELVNVEKQSLIKNILSSIENKEIYYCKNVFKDFLNWEDFIDLLNYQYEYSEISPGNPTDHRVINKISQKATNIVKYPEFHYHLLEIDSSNNINSLINNYFFYIKNLMEYFKEIITNKFTLKALFNFVGNEFTGMIHDDPYHVLSMQHFGNVEYNILDLNGNKTTYVLEPGDLIFMPSGTKHSINAPDPRGTLIFDIETIQ